MKQKLESRCKNKDAFKGHYILGARGFTEHKVSQLNRPPLLSLKLYLSDVFYLCTIASTGVIKSGILLSTYSMHR